MPTAGMLQAKSHLSRLVAAVEYGSETEIVIARNGRPAARLVAITGAQVGRHIGVAKGKFDVPVPNPTIDAKIEKMFRGGKK